MKRIVIRVGGVQAIAELNDSPTASAVWQALPISAAANTWGSEIYFAIPVHLQEEDAQALVSLGDLGYWPRGNAFCIFFGPTPMSRGSEIRPASPVNIFGHLTGDPKVFDTARDGETITVERLQDP